jgi:hypothetical protein
MSIVIAALAALALLFSTPSPSLKAGPTAGQGAVVDDVIPPLGL